MTHNLVPSTDIPRSEVDILVADSFYIEAWGGGGGGGGGKSLVWQYGRQCGTC